MSFQIKGVGSRYNLTLLRDQITTLIGEALKSLVAAGKVPAELLTGTIEVTDTKTPEHGDFACAFALTSSKRAGMPPRALAEVLRAGLLDSDAGKELLNEIEIAGPGFLNLRLRPEAIARFVPEIIRRDIDLPSQERAQESTPRLSINVEFVSVNPNGPITVGSGRGAAFGDSLSRVLIAAGHRVSREYYINDGVNSEQMRLFAESVRSHALGIELPEKGYKGEYVLDVATKVLEMHPEARSNTDIVWWQNVSQDLMIERQRGDLAVFGVHFDRWFSEQSMHVDGKVSAALEHLRKTGAADDECFSNEIVREGKEERLERKTEDCGPLWLRSTRWGDDKDRVLLRSDGRPAYIAGDVAYLESKLGERKFDKAILIVGPDHHGYVPRLKAICQALGYAPERFEIVIFQLVRFVKDGHPAPMRKRDGNIYELRDLVDELGNNIAPNAELVERRRVGSDVARFFYLMRSHDTHMDFDIDLATKQNDENPVFYVQYAHARICSVIARAAVQNLYATEPDDFEPSKLVNPRELALVKKILDLPYEVKRCADDYGVHRLTTYAVELARSYHHFYDACRVIQPEQPDLTRARLSLCQAARIGLRAALLLLGITAPERMDRVLVPDQGSADPNAMG